MGPALLLGCTACQVPAVRHTLRCAWLLLLSCVPTRQGWPGVTGAALPATRQRLAAPQSVCSIYYRLSLVLVAGGSGRIWSRMCRTCAAPARPPRPCCSSIHVQASRNRLTQSPTQCAELAPLPMLCPGRDLVSPLPLLGAVGAVLARKVTGCCTVLAMVCCK